MNLVRVKPPRIAFALLAAAAGLHFLLPERFRRDLSCFACGIIGVSAGFGIMTWA